MTVTDGARVDRHARSHPWLAAAIGLAWVAATAVATWSDPMTFAFAGLLGATVLLPLAERALDYAIAAAIVAVAVAIDAGFGAATVVAAFAFGLWGGVALLRACRVDGRFAIASAIVASLALLTWPIWAAELLLKFESQRLVDGLVWTGPAFAINRAIDPTDAFTHRPWSYRWMNLGQDVPYALPATIWPCVLVHGSISVLGLLAAQKGRNTNRREKKANLHEQQRAAS